MRRGGLAFILWLLTGAALFSMSLGVLAHSALATPNVAVGPQYDSTHVYIAPQDIDRFVSSFLATFGGQSTKRVVTMVTPTARRTTSQVLHTPAGMVSLFGFMTPIPYPFAGSTTSLLRQKAAIREQDLSRDK